MIKQLKSLAWQVIRAGQKSTAFLDAAFLRQDIAMPQAPFFIIGPPRSGTTLLYQLMVQAFRFSYFPNIANTFYQCPIFAAKLAKKSSRDYSSQFESGYGYEKGMMSPSEAGNIWNRWFPHESQEGFNYTPAGYLAAGTRNEIRQTVAQFTKLFDAPFITKNVKMSVRLPAIQEVFPNANLIQIKRDPLESALSLLKIRRRRGGGWWSAMPKEIEAIKPLSEWEQAACQVYFLEKNIADDIQLFPPDQHHIVHYSDVCKDAHKTLADIKIKFPELIEKTEIKNSDIPKDFQPSKPDYSGIIAPEEIEKIKNFFTNDHKEPKLMLDGE